MLKVVLDLDALSAQEIEKNVKVGEDLYAKISSRNFKGLTDEKIQAISQGNVVYIKFDAYNDDISVEDIRVLVQILKKSPKIKEIKLANMCLTPNALTALLNYIKETDRFTSIFFINTITSKEVNDVFSSFTHLKCLENLAIIGSSITNDSYDNLRRLIRYNTSITNLAFIYCGINNKTLQLIGEELFYNKTLSVLDFNCNHEITKAGIRDFAKKLLTIISNNGSTLNLQSVDLGEFYSDYVLEYIEPILNIVHPVRFDKKRADIYDQIEKFTNLLIPGIKGDGFSFLRNMFSYKLWEKINADNDLGDELATLIMDNELAEHITKEAKSRISRTEIVKLSSNPWRVVTNVSLSERISNFAMGFVTLSLGYNRSLLKAWGANNRQFVIYEKEGDIPSDPLVVNKLIDKLSINLASYGLQR